MPTELKRATVYLTAEEYAEFEHIAADEKQTISQAIRAKLGLPYIRRGAPEGSQNRSTRKRRKKARAAGS